MGLLRRSKIGTRGDEGVEKKEKKHSLRRRWLKTSISVTCVIVAVFIAVFSLGAYSYYHSSAQKALVAKADSTASFFNDYLFTTYGEYYQSACQYAESFHSDEVMELQFINARAGIERASDGADPIPTDTDDVAQALGSRETSVWSGREDSSGLRVMSVTAPLFADGGQLVGAMRFVQSLDRVDRQFSSAALMALVVGLLIVLTVIVSSSYFLRTVSEPLVELTALAHRIADGSYGIEAEKKYDDEIGDLIDAINEMSHKIGETERTQTEFISSVSHELRTPLTAITGWAETLAYDETITGDSRRGIAIISKESGRLTKMVEELLEFTRIQDGRFTLNLERLDVAGELEDAIFTYGELLRQEGVTVEYTPPEQEIPLILGDPARLRQVFLNIMDNAAKYGRSAGRITVTIGAAGGWVVIRFRDYGPGVPEDELPFVKRKFYKGSGKERGSGIGLSVCDEIVTRHNGSLELANSRDGRSGLVVTISLPIIKEEELTI